jgi:hypothetical protein
MNGGLFRPPTLMTEATKGKGGLARIIADRKYGHRPNFAKHISGLIKKHSSVPGATSKTLRHTSATIAFNSKQVTKREGKARGGWFDTDTVDTYYLSKRVEHTFPAGKILSGWLENPEIVYAARLPLASVPYEVWDEIITDIMSPISLSYYMPGGTHRNLLHVKLASFLRFYNQAHLTYSMKDHSAVNKALNKLRASFAIKATNYIPSNQNPHIVLSGLSKIVFDDFEFRNLPVVDDNSSCMAILASLEKRMIKVTKELEASQKEVRDLKTEIQIDSQKKDNTLREILLLLRSSSSTSPSKRSHANMLLDSQIIPPMASLQQSSTSSSSSQGVVTTTDKPKLQLNLNQAASSKTPVKGLTLSSLINSIATMKQMASILSGRNEFNYDEGSKVKRSIALMHHQMTEKEFNDLSSYSTERSVELMNLCKVIETRCMDYLNVKENEGTVEGGAKKKSKAEPLVLGVGSRLGALGLAVEELQKDRKKKLKEIEVAQVMVSI